MASQEALKRIARKTLHSKLMSAEQASLLLCRGRLVLSGVRMTREHGVLISIQHTQTIPFFKHGQAVGWSGFAPAGYPKVVPAALADHVEKNKYGFTCLS